MLLEDATSNYWVWENINVKWSARFQASSTSKWVVSQRITRIGGALCSFYKQEKCLIQQGGNDLYNYNFLICKKDDSLFWGFNTMNTLIY